MSTQPSDRIESDVAIPPGLLVSDELAARGMSQREFATTIGCSANTVTDIVAGRREITPKTALELERVLEIPAHIWVRLEADYRLALEKESRACSES